MPPDSQDDLAKQAAALGAEIVRARKSATARWRAPSRPVRRRLAAAVVLIAAVVGVLVATLRGAKSKPAPVPHRASGTTTTVPPPPPRVRNAPARHVSPAPPPLPEVKVTAGESFWSIASEVEGRRLGHPPAPAQVAGYWVQLVSANSARLVHAGDPDLIYPGQTFVLPPA